jgi:hypothetical protein
MKTFLTTLMLSVAISGLAQTSTTTTSLVADKQTGLLGTIFTLTVTVTDAKGPVKLGQVTFYDGDPSGPASALGTVVLNKANGTATLKRGFAIGSHAITAKFLGTNTDAPSSSSSPTITVTGKYASTTKLYPVGSGNNQKLVAEVGGQGLIPITGSVTFTDTTTNTVVGTSPLNTAVLRNKFQLKSTTESNGNYAVAADFNGDGKLDLATSGKSGVQVFLGMGDGTFGPGKPVPLLSTLQEQALIAGDFNGDGKQDLAIIASSGPCDLVMALGHGDGSFELLPPVSVGGSTGCYSVTVGDFNNDGKLDLAVATEDYPTAAINILLGHGNGEFQSSQILSTSGVGQTWLLATDLNGDGKTDLAYLPFRGTVSIFIGHGNGTFSSGLDVPSSVEGRYLEVGDFNGDGKPDLMISSPGIGAPSQIAVLLGHGNGTFEEVDTTLSLPDPESLAVGDFNGDGKLDVVVLDHDEGAPPPYEVLLGHGNGTFLGLGPVSIPDTHLIEFGFTFVGDFNNDGVLDFGSEVSNFNTSMYNAYVLINNGTSTAAAGLNGIGAKNPISAIYSGDSNFAPSSTSSQAH